MRLGFPIFLFFACTLFLSGCGKKNAEEHASPIELLRSDLQDLRARPHAGPALYDASSAGRFAQIFGGTTLTDVGNYLDARLHYYVDPDDRSLGISPSNLFNQSWLRPARPRPPTNSKVGASNLGVELWLAGLTARVPVVFELNGGSVAIDDPRVGIMLIGEGYTSTDVTESGQTIKLPAEYRQSILVHEARHSDCTGGISQADLQTLRDAADDDGTNALVAGMHCGHLHVKCPVGHSYYDLAACDNEPWGAYTVGEIYYRGVREDPNISAYDRAIADAVIVDFESRSLVPRTGTPDMSSAGVQ